MKKIYPKIDWLESWKISYFYDSLEIYGEKTYPGYFYAYKQRYEKTLALIQKVAYPGCKILDVAAAQGNFSLALAEIGYDITWNDLRSELIDYVKLKWEYGSISYMPGNVFDLSFEAAFDIILIAEVIEHTAHPDQFLKKIAAMVKPNGYIVMSTPNGGYFRNQLPKFSDCLDPSLFESIQFSPDADGHIFLLHIDEIFSLSKSAGLQILEVSLFSNPLTNGHIKLAALLQFLPSQWIEQCETWTQNLPLKLQKKINAGMAVLFKK